MASTSLSMFCRHRSTTGKPRAQSSLKPNKNIYKQSPLQAFVLLGPLAPVVQVLVLFILIKVDLSLGESGLPAREWRPGVASFWSAAWVAIATCITKESESLGKQLSPGLAQTPTRATHFMGLKELRARQRAAPVAFAYPWQHLHQHEL